MDGHDVMCEHPLELNVVICVAPDSVRQLLGNAVSNGALWDNLGETGGTRTPQGLRCSLCGKLLDFLPRPKLGKNHLFFHGFAWRTIGL